MTEAGKSLFNTAVGGSALAAAGALGGLELIALTASQPFGERITSEKMPSSKFRDKSSYGLIQGTGVYATLKIAYETAKKYMGDTFTLFGNSISKSYLVGTGIALAAVPFLTAFAYPWAYFFNNNYSFKGLFKSVKEKYGTATKDSLYTYGLTTAAGVGAALAMPLYAPIFLIGSGFLGNVFYKLKTSEKWYLGKIFTPITSTTSGLASASYKVAKGVGEAAYAIGSSIVSGISEILKSAAAFKPAPAAAPATQPA